MLLPVLHPSNPVKALSAQQLQAIFAGNIDNWKQVGGNDAGIHVYTRDVASGTRSVFWKKALSKGDVTPKAQCGGVQRRHENQRGPGSLRHWVHVGGLY